MFYYCATACSKGLPVLPLLYYCRWLTHPMAAMPVLDITRGYLASDFKRKTQRDKESGTQSNSDTKGEKGVWEGGEGSRSVGEGGGGCTLSADNATFFVWVEWWVLL
jgi:hypothetical protein